MSVRLTGPVAMADDEFGTVADGALLNVILTVIAVLLILWFALRSGRLMFAVMLSLFVGLAITAALGLAMVGALNLISVAFAVLFVGIGVDFGIQVAVRYRQERHVKGDLARRSCRDCRADRKAAHPCRDRDCRRLLCLPAHRLSRRVGARADLGHRHARRLRHQHHASARAPAAAQASSRAGSGRLPQARSGRPLHGPPPRAHPHSRRARCRGGAAALQRPQVRFQSAELAQRQSGIGRDPARPDAGPRDARRM